MWVPKHPVFKFDENCFKKGPVQNMITQEKTVIYLNSLVSRLNYYNMRLLQ